VFKRIVSRITAAAISISLYIPIIAGILSQMVWILVSWYFSWGFLSYIVPYSAGWAGFVYMFSPTFPEELRIGIAVAFRFSQVLLFCFGLFLLCYGLVTLTKARVHKEGLVTYGPYSWVRHPQHLGILLMLYLLAFPLKTSFSRLLYPATRPGDLMSICSVLFLLILVADLEDYWLSKEFGDSFVKYQQDTPFILPIRLHLPESLHFRALARGRPLRYIAATLFFWAFLVLLSYYFRLVPPPLVR
jgi:protein-S-isoprenylcysteine O-methyltransferase Ste14